MMAHLLLPTIISLLTFQSLANGNAIPPEVPLDRAEMAMLPPGREEKSVAVFFPSDWVTPLELETQQNLLLSNDMAKSALTRAFHVLRRESWFVIGMAGSNETSLARVSKILSMLPRHLIVVEREQRPFEWEMDLQNRQLVWKSPIRSLKVLPKGSMSRQAKNGYFALQGGHSYSLHCPTVGVPRGHEIVPTASCSRERRCTMKKQLASCPSNPFKGRLVRVGTQPGFSYTIPGDYFGKPTAGSIVQISRLLARKYDFTLNYNVGPAGDFDRKTKSFTNGSHLRVKLSLFRL